MLTKELIEQTAFERVRPLKEAKLSKDDLLISEIYRSLQGESTYAGLPCVFIRTTACHLRCTYCDTASAFSGGQAFSVAELIERIEAFNTPLVELTGGEPLLQKGSIELMTQLCDKGFTVLIETSGALSIKNIDRRVKVILDIKTPGSKQHRRNCWANLALLWPGCEIKFVICDNADYQFAKEICQKYDLFSRVPVLLSAEASGMDRAQLAEWILADHLPFRQQIQLHKVLWGDKPGV